MLLLLQHLLPSTSQHAFGRKQNKRIALVDYLPPQMPGQKLSALSAPPSVPSSTLPCALIPFDLTTEAVLNPIGVQSRTPQLGFKVRGDEAPRQYVTAYQIQVRASSLAWVDSANTSVPSIVPPLLWDSRRVACDDGARQRDWGDARRRTQRDGRQRAV